MAWARSDRNLTADYAESADKPAFWISGCFLQEEAENTLRDLSAFVVNQLRDHSRHG